MGEDELHAFFESYFLGSGSSLHRADAAFAQAFTFIGANGTESDRAGVMQMLLDGHAHTNRLTITTTDHRLSTVVFVADPVAPNGLLWLRVHETWLPWRIGLRVRRSASTTNDVQTNYLTSDY